MFRCRGGLGPEVSTNCKARALFARFCDGVAHAVDEADLRNPGVGSDAAPHRVNTEEKEYVAGECYREYLPSTSRTFPFSASHLFCSFLDSES